MKIRFLNMKLVLRVSEYAGKNFNRRLKIEISTNIFRYNIFVIFKVVGVFFLVFSHRYTIYAMQQNK